MSSLGGRGPEDGYGYQTVLERRAKLKAGEQKKKTEEDSGFKNGKEAQETAAVGHTGSQLRECGL